MSEAFFVAEGDDTYVATDYARGPWDVRFQHGGPPSALLAGALARFEGGDDFALARLTVDFRRPVPIGRLTVAVTPVRLGRSVQRLTATLSHEDTVVLEARGLRIRERPGGPVSDPPVAEWDPPESIERMILPFFLEPVGFHQAVDLRFVGGPWGATPIQLWARPIVELVEGRPMHPLERVVVLADAQSGMGPPLDPLRYNFANPDLTVLLDRMPKGEWLGFDIRSSTRENGIGLSQASIRDREGAFGRSAQTLIVTARPDG